MLRGVNNNCQKKEIITKWELGLLFIGVTLHSNMLARLCSTAFLKAHATVKGGWHCTATLKSLLTRGNYRGAGFQKMSVGLIFAVMTAALWD